MYVTLSWTIVCIQSDWGKDPHLLITYTSLDIVIFMQTQVKIYYVFVHN